LSESDSELLQLGRPSVAILSGDVKRGLNLLNRFVGDGKLGQPAAYLILSDIAIYEGDLDAAVEKLKIALQQFPLSTLLYSQLARIYLLADQLQKSQEEAVFALSTDGDSVDANLVSGDIARINGDSETARGYYRRTTKLKPAEDRAWYGLGQINTEREEIRTGRENLQRAARFKTRCRQLPGATGNA